eukprot:3006555-Prymnesium_polylepis.1
MRAAARTLTTAAAQPFKPRLSQRAKDLPPNAFIDLVPLMKDPSVSVLSQGVPPASTFPLMRCQFDLADGSTVTLDPQRTALAQRYPQFAWAELRAWLIDHMRALHNPPCVWDLCVAAGAMSSVDIVVSMLADRGEVVLVEEYSFTAALDVMVAAGLRVVPVALDADGIVPSALEAACEALAAEGVSPRLLYTIPVGQNPTGSRLAAERYSEVYAIARKYAFTIVEDDPPIPRCPPIAQHRANEPATEVPGLNGLGTSYLSIDCDGRVVRLDSFSKVLAPGFRIGWVSGAAHYVQTYSALCFISSQWGCSLSIMLLSQMLAAPGWFEAQVRALQQTLRARCLALVSASDEHLGGLVTYRVPPAGMFLWCTLAGSAPTVNRRADIATRGRLRVCDEAGVRLRGSSQ